MWWFTRMICEHKISFLKLKKRLGLFFNIEILHVTNVHFKIDGNLLNLMLMIFLGQNEK